MKLVNQRILAGFLTRDEVLAQAQGLTAMSTPAAKRKFWEDFRSAHAYRAKLTDASQPKPSFVPLPDAAAAHLTAVESSDAFQESFGGLTYRFEQVGLDALQPVQIFTNVEPKLTPPDPKDLEALLRYCLPSDPRIPADVRITPTGVQFATDRYGHGAQNLRRRIVNGQVHLSFEHPNLLQVVHFKATLNGQVPVERAVVLNGNHRALELLSAGHKTAPALVLEINDVNALTALCPQGAGFWNANFLLAAGTPLFTAHPRPAYTSDFLTPLAIECSSILVPSIVDVTVGTGTPQAPQQQQPIAIQLRPVP